MIGSHRRVERVENYSQTHMNKVENNSGKEMEHTYLKCIRETKIIDKRDGKTVTMSRVRKDVSVGAGSRMREAASFNNTMTNRMV